MAHKHWCSHVELPCMLPAQCAWYELLDVGVCTCLAGNHQCIPQLGAPRLEVSGPNRLPRAAPRHACTSVFCVSRHQEWIHQPMQSAAENHVLP